MIVQISSLSNFLQDHPDSSTIMSSKRIDAAEGYEFVFSFRGFFRFTFSTSPLRYIVSSVVYTSFSNGRGNVLNI